VVSEPGRKNKSNPHHSYSRAKSLEMQHKVLQLRLAGLSYRKIARELGISLTSVARYMDKALEGLKEQIQHERERYVYMQLERLDTILSRLWPKIHDGHLGAIDRALRVLDQQARLLGLYEAPAVQVHGPIQLLWPEEEVLEE